MLSSTSEGGGSAGFQLLAEYSPVEARRLVGRLLDLFETTYTALTGAPTDAAVYAGMMTRLKARRTVQTDYSGIIKGGVA